MSTIASLVFGAVTMLIGTVIGGFISIYVNNQTIRATERQAAKQAKRAFGAKEIERDRATLADFMELIDTPKGKLVNISFERTFAEMRLMPGISTEGITDDMQSPDRMTFKELDHWGDVFGLYLEKRKRELFE